MVAVLTKVTVSILLANAIQTKAMVPFAGVMGRPIRRFVICVRREQASPVWVFAENGREIRRPNPCGVVEAK